MTKKNSKHKAIHFVAATIFGIVAIVHILRLGYGVPVQISTWQMPLWLSWIGVFVTGSLAVLLWQSANNK
ncbi:hypothetical protein GF343_00265 [Candidatus Woesearchaeota archaeon]|nr:hypothetical protein [Candidatus Woesearchaeota archaeon]